MRSAIDESVTDGLLIVNPVTLVSASRYHVIDNSTSSDDYVVDTFTPAETNAIYQSYKYTEWENLFRFVSIPVCVVPNCARWPDLDNIVNTAHVQAASVVGVLKGTKTNLVHEKLS